MINIFNQYHPSMEIPILCWGKRNDLKISANIAKGNRDLATLMKKRKQGPSLVGAKICILLLYLYEQNSPSSSQSPLPSNIKKTQPCE